MQVVLNAGKPGRNRGLRQIRITRPLDEANEMEAVMLAHPSLAWRSLSINISNGKQTTLLACHGTAPAIAALKRDYALRPPKQFEHIEVVDEARTHLVLYEVERSGSGSTDISHWIEQILGPETVVQLTKNKSGVAWDIITFHDDKVPPFLHALERAGSVLRARINRHISWYKLEPQRPLRARRLTQSDLGSKEEHVAREAFERGYYATPKRVSIRDVARACGIPDSTAQYRLARAEYKIMQRSFGASPNKNSE